MNQEFGDDVNGKGTACTISQLGEQEVDLDIDDDGSLANFDSCLPMAADLRRNLRNVTKTLPDSGATFSMRKRNLKTRNG
jgi:hypothetical protein